MVRTLMLGAIVALSAVGNTACTLVTAPVTADPGEWTVERAMSVVGTEGSTLKGAQDASVASLHRAGLVDFYLESLHDRPALPVQDIRRVALVTPPVNWLFLVFPVIGPWAHTVVAEMGDGRQEKIGFQGSWWNVIPLYLDPAQLIHRISEMGEALDFLRQRAQGVPLLPRPSFTRVDVACFRGPLDPDYAERLAETRLLPSILHAGFVGEYCEAGLQWSPSSLGATLVVTVHESKGPTYSTGDRGIQGPRFTATASNITLDLRLIDSDGRTTLWIKRLEASAPETGFFFAARAEWGRPTSSNALSEELRAVTLSSLEAKVTVAARELRSYLSE